MIRFEHVSKIFVLDGQRKVVAGFPANDRRVPVRFLAARAPC
jgi:hypothetical protein